MSAVAGTEAGAVVNWASLPSLGHVVPPSGHGACTSLAAAWGKDQSRRGGRGWVGILPNIWASKPNNFAIRKVLMVHVDSWQLGSSPCKKLPLGS